jgi:hypothetical protein
MTNPTPLELRLGTLISAYADRAPVVVDPVAMTRLSAAASAERSPGLFRPTRDWAYFGLVLALLVALAAGAVAVAGQMLLRESNDRLTDRVLVAPFEGLAPDAAPPSSPEHGELVLSFDAQVKALGDDVHAMWLYEDGRLIWRRNLDNVTDIGARAFGAMKPTTAVLEQRLTQEGIRLLVAEALTPEALIGDHWGHGPEVLGGELRVKVDGQVTGIHWDSWELPRRLADPGRWLPGGAWADQRISAFVPSRYAITISPGDFDRLPAPVHAVLRVNGFRDGLADPGQPDSFTVSTEVAREIAAVLDREGTQLDSRPKMIVGRRFTRQAPIGGERPMPMGGLWYTFGDGDTPAGVSLEPILPHGETLCLTCG